MDQAAANPENDEVLGFLGAFPLQSARRRVYRWGARRPSVVRRSRSRETGRRRTEMRKKIGIALLAVLALSLAAGAMITPVEAKSLGKCELVCRQGYMWYCCDGPADGPGCVIVDRCE